MTPRERLWEVLAPLFAENDGSLPELLVEGLDGAAVDAAFECLRRDEREPFPESQYLWLRGEGVPLANVERPAAAVADGTAEPFHCVLTGVESGGVRLPELGVFVFPDAIHIDYRMGPEWDAVTVAALVDRLAACLPPDATVRLWDVYLPEVRARSDAAIAEYLRATRTPPPAAPRTPPPGPGAGSGR